MAYSVIAHEIARSTNDNNVTTPAIDTSGADFIVLAAAYLQGVTMTISDSKSNTWTPRTQVALTGDSAIRLYYVQGGTVGTGHTFTASGTGSFPSLAALALSGSVASPFDLENGAQNASASSIQPGSITPSENNEILITAISLNNNFVTASINGGFTISDQANATANAYGLAMAYLIQTTAAAANPTWSWTNTIGVATTQASFKDTAGAATGQPTTKRHGGTQFMGVGLGRTGFAGGGYWGRSTAGRVVVPRWLSDQERQAA